MPNTSGGDGPLRRRSRLSGRRENWRTVVVLVRVSLKGLSILEICVHRRSFYGSERVAEHKRRRCSFAAPLKGERAAKKLEECRRSCARILEGPIYDSRQRPTSKNLSTKRQQHRRRVFAKRNNSFHGDVHGARFNDASALPYTLQRRSVAASLKVERARGARRGV